MKILPSLGLALALALSAGCDSGPKGSRGFSLPDGDPQAGREQFVNLGCNSCHKIEGVPYTGDTGREIRLGGQTTRIKTYGKLVTSIINPSHKVAAANTRAVRGGLSSEMVHYNEIMTVAQLVDLVAFVQSSYTLSEYARSNYPIYYVEK